MAEQTDVAQVVAMIGEAFPNFSPTAHTVKVYFELLKDLPADLLKAAAVKSIAEAGRKFAPSVGELRGAVADIQRYVAGVPSSYQAWEEVRRAMADVGYYGTPQFSHPLVGDAVRTLGWRDLCLSETPASDRMRFIQAYEQLAGRAEAESMMPPVVRGYIETHGGKLLAAPMEQIKQLAGRLEK